MKELIFYQCVGKIFPSRCSKAGRSHPPALTKQTHVTPVSTTGSMRASPVRAGTRSPAQNAVLHSNTLTSSPAPRNRSSSVTMNSRPERHCLRPLTSAGVYRLDVGRAKSTTQTILSSCASHAALSTASITRCHGMKEKHVINTIIGRANAKIAMSSGHNEPLSGRLRSVPGMDAE